MAPATASAASLINVATMAGPRTNEEKFIDIRWLSPADQPVRWLVGASMFEYESLSAQWFGYAGYLLGLEDELQTLWEADEKTSGQPSNVDDPWRFRSRDNELTKNIGIYGSVQWDISDRTTRSPVHRATETGRNNPYRYPCPASPTPERESLPRTAASERPSRTIAVRPDPATSSSAASLQRTRSSTCHW